MATKNVLQRPIDYTAADGQEGSLGRRLKSWHSAILSTAILIVIVSAAILFRGIV